MAPIYHKCNNKSIQIEYSLRDNYTRIKSINHGLSLKHQVIAATQKLINELHNPLASSTINSTGNNSSQCTLDELDTPFLKALFDDNDNEANIKNNNNTLSPNDNQKLAPPVSGATMPTNNMVPQPQTDNAHHFSNNDNIPTNANNENLLTNSNNENLQTNSNIKNQASPALTTNVNLSKGLKTNNESSNTKNNIKNTNEKKEKKSPSKKLIPK